MFSVLSLGTLNGKKLVLRTILQKLLITEFYLFYLVSEKENFVCKEATILKLSDMGTVNCAFARFHHSYLLLSRYFNFELSLKSGWCLAQGF